MSDSQTAPGSPASKHAGLNGWVEAILYTVAIGVLSLTYAIAIKMGAHVIVFIFYAMFIGAIGLVLVKGPGRDAREIAAAPISWLIGAMIIGMELFYYLTLLYVPPADASLLVRTSIPLSLVIGSLFFGRRVRALGWFGGALVLAAVLYLMSQLTLPEQLGGLLAALACGVIVNVRAFATEMHRWNRAATTVSEKMRVTGVVILVTAVGGLVLTGLAIGLAEAGLMPRGRLIPELHHLVHPPTIVLALLVGGIVYSAMSYLGFSCVVKIGSEGFIASSAFTPVSTLLVQLAASATGWITFPPFDWRLLPPMAAAIVGVLIIVWSGRRGRLARPA